MGSQRASVQLEVAALEVGHVLPEEEAHALDGLLEDVEALAHGREGDAVGGVLVERPARAETEVGPAAAQVVDRGDGVGEHGGVPVAGAVHQRAAPDPAGVARRARCGRRRLVARVAR